MKITIEQTTNGYISTLDLGDGEKGRSVYQQGDDPKDALIELLRDIANEFEPGSRYDARRIYIVTAPGDKHPDFNPERADVLFSSGNK